MGSLYRTLTGQSQKSNVEDVNNLTNVKSIDPADPLSGYLNHLNPLQQERLEEFKAKLQKDGWWTPEGPNGRPSHDNATLLRYLRARKFDVQGAIGQFTDTEKWLNEQHVDELYETFDVDTYEQARLMYPQWTGHRDKRGIPIYVFVIKGLDSKTVNKYQKDTQTYKDSLPTHKSLATPAKLLPLFALYHNLLNFVLPMCSSLDRPNSEVPITNSTNIVDISGVGLTQFWNLKNHMQEASVLATAHYPETLDRIFIIGAPSFFPTVWGWIKRWFDPVTVSKIFILSKHEVKPTLLRFMNAKDFPRRYGGELDWDWGQVPSLEGEVKEAVERDGRKGWIKGPCLWLDKERVIVGSEDGKPRTPNVDIASKKPPVYGADDTENPVHPDRKVSTQRNGALKHSNGSAEPTSEQQLDVAKAAPIGSLEGTTTMESNKEKDVNTASTAVVNAKIASGENIKTAPIDGAAVKVPEQQPAPPAITAEYIAPDKQENLQSATVASNMADTKTVEVQASQPPAGIPQPGPIPDHTVAMTQAITEKMEGESISTIPASANGTIPHPEVTIVSDQSTGLALETEKLDLSAGNVKSEERPKIDRFVTASEI